MDRLPLSFIPLKVYILLAEPLHATGSYLTEEETEKASQLLDLERLPEQTKNMHYLLTDLYLQIK